jgi:hypothetical protein
MGRTSPKQSVPSCSRPSNNNHCSIHTCLSCVHTHHRHNHSFQSAGAVTSTSISMSTPPDVVYSRMTPPPKHNQGRSSSHSSLPIGGSVPPPYRYCSQRQSHLHLHSYSNSQHQQQQGSNLPSSRPSPRIGCMQALLLGPCHNRLSSCRDLLQTRSE